MKKAVIYLGMITIITSLGRATVSTENIVDKQQVEGLTRAQFKAFSFHSKPPKQYKGLTLVNEKKIKGGYVGYYV